MTPARQFLGHLAIAIGLLAGPAAQAGEVAVAVAANVAAPMKEIAARFERDTGHQAKLSFGATGKFHAQIVSGAPFQVFLSADDETPARLEREGHAVAGTRFVYATGTLVLWSSDPARVDPKGEVLRRGDFARLAIANPRLAPYGRAAVETLAALGLRESTASKWVQGENIAQTHQFVASGNAELGFVALSQVMQDGRLGSGSGWIVPDTMHAPIRQDAVLLVAGRDHPAATALLRYLRGAPAQAILRAYGYR